MMRIRFGLTLKITERTKYYKPLKKKSYFIKQPDSQAKLSLFSGSHPNYSFRGLSPVVPTVPHSWLRIVGTRDWTIYVILKILV